MTDYSIVLFLHIVGALGCFIALGLEWTGLWQMRHATMPQQFGTWMGVLNGVRKAAMASMLATILTGVYLTLREWGAVAWILVGLGSLVLVIVLSLVLSGPRMAAIGQALGRKEVSPEAYRSLANHPLLWLSIQTRVAIALGIVFLNTVKPGWGGSLLTVGAAVLLGLAAGLHWPARERAQEGPAH